MHIRLVTRTANGNVPGMYRNCDSYPASIDLIVGKGMAMVCKPNKVYIPRDLPHTPYTV